jgi:hypothetical protein
MNAAETKDNLYKLIAETDDINILDKIQAYFTSLKSQNVDWWDSISEYEKKNIETGINQLAEGNKIPHYQVRKKVSKLIGK